MSVNYFQTDQSCLCPSCQKYVLFKYVSIANKMYKECPHCKVLILYSTTTVSEEKKIAYISKNTHCSNFTCEIRNECKRTEWNEHNVGTTPFCFAYICKKKIYVCINKRAYEFVGLHALRS